MLGTVSRASREVLMEARSVSEVFLIFGLDGLFCGFPVSPPPCGPIKRWAGCADTRKRRLNCGRGRTSPTCRCRRPAPEASVRLSPVRLLGSRPPCATNTTFSAGGWWITGALSLTLAPRKLKVIPPVALQSAQIFAALGFCEKSPASLDRNHLDVRARGDLRIRHRHFGGRSVRDAHGWTEMWNDARCADRGRAARGTICAFRTRGKRQWRECPAGGKKAEHQT